MKVTLLYFDGCPNWRTAADHLDLLAAEIPGLTVAHRQVGSDEDARRIGFRGSPSILIDGVDPFATGDAPTGLSCRMYRTPDGPAGSPTFDQLRDVVTGARS